MRSSSLERKKKLIIVIHECQHEFQNNNIALRELVLIPIYNRKNDKCDINNVIIMVLEIIIITVEQFLVGWPTFIFPNDVFAYKETEVQVIKLNKINETWFFKKSCFENKKIQTKIRRHKLVELRLQLLMKGECQQQHDTMMEDAQLLWKERKI